MSLLDVVEVEAEVVVVVVVVEEEEEELLLLLVLLLRLLLPIFPLLGVPCAAPARQKDSNMPQSAMTSVALKGGSRPGPSRWNLTKNWKDVEAGQKKN